MGRELLDAPGTSGEHLVADVVVAPQLPVADDHAVEAELLAQQSGEDLPVEAESHLLYRLAVDLEPQGAAVVRHDRVGPLG